MISPTGKRNFEKISRMFTFMDLFDINQPSEDLKMQIVGTLQLDTRQCLGIVSQPPRFKYVGGSLGQLGMVLVWSAMKDIQSTN